MNIKIFNFTSNFFIKGTNETKYSVKACGGIT